MRSLIFGAGVLMLGRGGLRRNASTALHHRVKLLGQYCHLLACHSRMARNDQFGIGRAKCPLACTNEQPRGQQYRLLQARHLTNLLGRIYGHQNACNRCTDTCAASKIGLHLSDIVSLVCLPKVMSRADVSNL